jgi:8-oxo-dGTP diphosphatase
MGHLRQDFHKMGTESDAPVFGIAPPDCLCIPRRAAYAVVAGTDGRVAVILARLRDGRDQYWLPGGGIEPGESPREAVVREIREELGRGARVQNNIGEAVQYFFAGDEGRWYQMKAAFFKASFDESPLTRSESELHWVYPRTSASLFYHQCHAWAATLTSSTGPTPSSS